jgi:hypothetical protein
MPVDPSFLPLEGCTCSACVEAREEGREEMPRLTAFPEPLQVTATIYDPATMLYTVTTTSANGRSIVRRPALDRSAAGPTKDEPDQ